HTSPTDIHTLSLHDALPISHSGPGLFARRPGGGEGAGAAVRGDAVPIAAQERDRRAGVVRDGVQPLRAGAAAGAAAHHFTMEAQDRKSTRLNSSHVAISYAV